MIVHQDAFARIVLEPTVSIEPSTFGTAAPARNLIHNEPLLFSFHL